jgi:hypothetical protein
LFLVLIGVVVGCAIVIVTFRDMAISVSLCLDTRGLGPQYMAAM